MFKKVNITISVWISLSLLLVMAVPAFAQAPTPPVKPDGGDWVAQLAQALNMSVDELKTEIKSGKNVAQLAEEKGVDLDTLVKDLTQKAQTRLQQSVSQGKITQAQADRRLKTLQDGLKKWFNSGRPPARVKADLMVIRDAKIVAEKLGLTEVELFKAVKNGSSVAQLAEQKGIDLDEVVQAVLNKHAESLQKAVDAGKLSQAQMDQRLETLKQQLISRFTDGRWQFKPGGNSLTEPVEDAG
ncbi:MAG: hypothetical protein LWX83_06750 [Anaerolineae bacterium]|nr:hypothetical protein [Anaerolineae bacterium]